MPPPADVGADTSATTISRDDRVLYISQLDVETSASSLNLVALMREMFVLHGQRKTVLPPEIYLEWPAARRMGARSLNMAGYVGGRFNVAGTKIINANISNPDRGLPRASGITVLIDPDTTRVHTILEGSVISRLRTAAVSCLAIELLQAECVEQVAMLGAGVIATAHLELLARQKAALEEVRIYDIRRPAAERLALVARRLWPAARIAIQLDAESTVRGADIVLAATTVTRGYVRHRWLKPGSVFVNVSLDDADRDVIEAADMIVVDDWSLVCGDDRRLLGQLYREGVVVGPEGELSGSLTGARPVDAELADLVLGRRPGRRSARQIVYVNPFGLAIADLVVAQEVARAARSSLRGIHLER